MESYLIRYYVHSERKGYYHLDSKIFYRNMNILPDESGFYSSDINYVTPKFNGLKENYPDLKLIKVEIPIRITVI